MSIDRRHFIPVLIAISVFSFINGNKLKLRTVIAGLVFISLMIVYALVRDNRAISDYDVGLLIYAGFAEFILTGYVSCYYISEMPKAYLLGRTYLWDTVTRMFPYAIFPWKPKDLGTLFMSEVLENRIGFAFNPVAEGILNFGKFSIFTTPIIIFIFMNLGYIMSKRNPLFYIVICAYSLDFCRGQFANCIFDVIFMWFVLNFMTKFKMSTEDRRT
ncbi:MAG: hypothetical protein PHX08_13335 [Lachnospiraceae bacterium]|nr:hypothetical protein [Lachnospiraceae bacterium]